MSENFKNLVNTPVKIFGSKYHQGTVGIGGGTHGATIYCKSVSYKYNIFAWHPQVYRASGDDFLSVAGGATCEAAAFLSRGAHVIVRMRGLPYDATPQQVVSSLDSRR